MEASEGEIKAIGQGKCLLEEERRYKGGSRVIIVVLSRKGLCYFIGLPIRARL